MDQRRITLFLALCFLLVIFFGPKPQPPKKQAPKLPPEQAMADPLAVALEEKPVLPDVERPPQPAEDETELLFATLGSVDPDDPYRLLATFTNRGAAIRRIELASPRFRDLHDRSGYLGHLELVSSTEGGLQVQSVGAGTPAAVAGLLTGDRILAAKPESDANQPAPLESPEAFGKMLAKTEPHQKLVLEVARDADQTKQFVVTLGRRPLEISRPEVENVLTRVNNLPDGFSDPPSFLFTFEQLGDSKLGKESDELRGIELLDGHWQIAERDESSITFRKRLPQFQVEVAKIYRLQQVPPGKRTDRNFPGYGLSLEIECRNLGEAPLDIAYRLDGPTGLPTEGWWYGTKIGRSWSAAGIRDVVARHVGSETVQFSPTQIAKGDVEAMQGPPLAFAGVDAQYFSAVLVPRKKNPQEIWIDEVHAVMLSPKPKARSNEGRYANVTSRLITHVTKLPPGETLQHTYDVFTGPKRPELLAQYEAPEGTQHTLGDLMYYGWFGGVAKLMLGILHFFYGIVGNYGIAIVMLTVLVRSCMFPISRKQAQSMVKMQELRPEMDKIKEKYKSDMQKQSQAMQELYRKYKINPLAGCLPMFIQLPIFLGLYRALMVDGELRQAPLISESFRWCSNLAAPDMFFDWSGFVPEFISSGEGIFGLGPYFNILPLITIALFLLQQKMFMPEPANEQAAMQQKIMKYMMLVMGLLFFKVASGLCLYFIASSLWGIAERKMLPAATPADGASDPTFAVQSKPSASRGGKNGHAVGSRQKKKSRKKR